ncbi:hypothetical protein HK097_004683 [Rhizophlyctis rosea]|uniref:Uncharacterized protein n=1 Tax=Rhizophlyctis rosea TaxID=64517 RepID=A0AAD5WZY2_9FUNG|nr:hypothetical protein HK097_004683 [Rhizophlyctis rosea]
MLTINIINLSQVRFAYHQKPMHNLRVNNLTELTKQLEKAFAPDAAADGVIASRLYFFDSIGRYIDDINLTSQAVPSSDVVYYTTEPKFDVDFAPTVLASAVPLPLLVFKHHEWNDQFFNTLLKGIEPLTDIQNPLSMGVICMILDLMKRAEKGHPSIPNSIIETFFAGKERVVQISDVKLEDQAVPSGSGVMGGSGVLHKDFWKMATILRTELREDLVKDAEPKKFRRGPQGDYRAAFHGSRSKVHFLRGDEGGRSDDLTAFVKKLGKLFNLGSHVMPGWRVEWRELAPSDPKLIQAAEYRVAPGADSGTVSSEYIFVGDAARKNQKKSDEHYK